MELLQIVLILLGAILVSAVLDEFLPRISLPLVQMAIGVFIYLFFKIDSDLQLNSDLFLVMFIAPLLFDESRNANNRTLWSNRNTILSLAIGLVLVTVLVTGFVLHIVVPTVSLAAAFAFAAALGPTDAVAVASMGKSVKLNSRQSALLTGEALLNDASGVVSFQFAIAAAVTGAFSITEASRTFAIDFVGGIVLGLVLGALAYLLLRNVRKAGIETVTFHVCFEVFLPFLVYLIAEEVHVSGILAVVAAGLLLAYLPQKASPRTRSYNTFSARLALASESVWSLISFVINGIIFVDLGYILSSTLAPALQENRADIVWLIGIVLLMTVCIMGVRLLWVLGCDFISSNPETGRRMEPGRDFLKNALVTTLAGPKGAVSLSIASTIPFVLSTGEAFPQRDLLLFLTCGVIIVTLLMANFVVPLLAPQSAGEESDDIAPEVEIEMFQNVIIGLKRQQTAENKQATGRVMRMYHRRIAAARRKTASARQLRFLRQEVLIQQRDYIREAIAREDVDRRLGETYLRRIEHMLKLLTRKRNMAQSAVQTQPLAQATSAMGRLQHQITSTNEERRRLEFKIEFERVAVDYLEQASHDTDAERAEAALALLSEHKPLLSALRSRLRSLDKAMAINTTAPEDASDAQVVRTESGDLRVESGMDEDEPHGMADVQAEALRLELDEIQGQYEKGNIPKAVAREKREEIYLLQMGLTE